MPAIVMRMERWGLLAIVLVALGWGAPSGAAARPPVGAAPRREQPFRVDSPHIDPGARLEVESLRFLSGAPRTARSWSVLAGRIRNAGDVGGTGRLIVRLVRLGSRPVAIGSTSVQLAAQSSAAYLVRARLPSGLRDGLYAAVACVRRSGGTLGCVTAERGVRVGPRAVVPVIAATTESPAGSCSPGAHSLSAPGAHLYPETGNGGYVSLHSDVSLDYDAATNLLLPGTHVALIDRATQCLTNFSLDFERAAAQGKGGPQMTVDSVLVNGHPASFAFVQPTYPGDPNGQDDPDPSAHEASQLDPVGGAGHNPLPPACTPELTSTSPKYQDSLDGTQCPANKLVVIPSTPIPSGSTFVVRIAYSGRPGVHHDGDGTTEGWFRNSRAGDTGSFVTTEPVGSEDWMPLNDHPSAKPTYDVYDTVELGKTAIANGELVSQTVNAPDANFLRGSMTWHWHSPEGIASYLVENSIGSYTLSEQLTTSGVQYYEAQDASIPPTQAAKNEKVIRMQQDVTGFQSMFNGSFPFTTDGVVIGLPPASFAEEMQTKITFPGGTIDLRTLNHENMHQWWGDNVSEASYNLTFFKEGLATFGEYLYLARAAQTAGGGPGTAAGRAAFEQSLANSFDGAYANAGSLWIAAPSDPRPFTLFSYPTTYARPGIAYIALRRILGPANFADALQQIQHQYRQASITEPQLEAGFAAFLPHPTPSCRTELGQFFTEWFDTVYPSGGGTNRPQITGPGLNGGGFHCGT